MRARVLASPAVLVTPPPLPKWEMPLSAFILPLLYIFTRDRAKNCPSPPPPPPTLKKQCHEIFYPFVFAQKTLPGTHMNKLKWFRELFSFSRRYSITELEIRVEKM